jgi:hypothetical protein
MDEGHSTVVSQSLVFRRAILMVINHQLVVFHFFHPVLDGLPLIPSVQKPTILLLYAFV